MWEVTLVQTFESLVGERGLGDLLVLLVFPRHLRAKFR